ncbi:hypothetical protein CN354_23910 [Bacillus cereus]|nr:hypothetical protein CN354_23910 [Bacillus cereus]WJE53708.1 hypothetical protein QRE66_05425 [Bacillus cereus]
MFIFVLFKVLVNFVLIGLILFLSITWTKIELFLNETLFKGVSKKVRNIITMAFVILIELMIIFIISLNWNISFIDALFVGSLVLLCYVWLVPYFVNYQQNIANVTDKHFSGGVEIGGVKVYRVKFSAFNLGSILFSVVGIIINICFYYKYFL